MRAGNTGGRTDCASQPKKLDRAAADPALAGSHAAAGVQLSLAPSGTAADALPGDIFAAAHEGLGGGQVAQFGAESEGAFESGGEALVRARAPKKRSASLVLPAAA